jgi:ribonuclease HII
MPPDFLIERTQNGLVAGVDEAGRGPWAGPVIAAAVIFRRRRAPDGIDDSKKLTAEKREALYDQLMESAIVGIGEASVAEIDRYNILGATMLAMQRAVAALAMAPDHALVDGNRAPGLSCPVTTVVEGDALSLSIAAASIIAKVTRDRMMVRHCDEFPGYGFARHKGYGTPQHRDALGRLGPCAIHRLSFAPVESWRLNI